VSLKVSFVSVDPFCEKFIIFSGFKSIWIIKFTVFELFGICFTLLNKLLVHCNSLAYKHFKCHCV